jgi:CRISPR-associated protein Cmr3
MTTMNLFFSPIDVWLFRDGRPFDAGDDHYARSLFPPYPSVMQGAIRSHHLVVKGIDLCNKQAIEQTVGTVDTFGSLRLRGPFMARRWSDGQITCYFPVPADAVPCDAKYVKTAQAQSASAHRVITSVDEQLSLLLFPYNIEPVKVDQSSWLSEKHLHDCLNGQKVEPLHAHELFLLEHRYGVGIETHTRTAREGLLYAAEFIRPQEGIGLYIEVTGYDSWPQRGVVRFGGESRVARFEQVERITWPVPPDPLPQRFKLYFASPAYFAKGWQPDDWNKFFYGAVKLKAVALKHYEIRGGFDLATGEQKPARRFVPAGSVYYFEGNSEVRFRSDLIQHAITDYGAEIGFGQVIVAEWSL